jgi:hypothetical protein
MVERERLEEYRLANKELSRLVKRDLTAFFASLNLGRPEAARNALLEFLPMLTAQYGDIAASVAAEFYEEMRASAGTRGSFTALGAAGAPAEAVEARVRSTAAHLWTSTPEAMLGGLLLASDKFVKQSGRNTIAQNAKREGVRYARVPKGGKTCAWCLLLASRDAVYLTKKSAGDGGKGVGDDFHGDCNCEVVRIGKPSDYPTHYLPDEFYNIYEESRKEAGSGDIKDITAAMRVKFPDLVTDGVHTH